MWFIGWMAKLSRTNKQSSNLVWPMNLFLKLSHLDIKLPKHYIILKKNSHTRACTCSNLVLCIYMCNLICKGNYFLNSFSRLYIGPTLYYALFECYLLIVVMATVLIKLLL